jgi:uncharacterized membrane protein SpoIIM required for sporulation
VIQAGFISDRQELWRRLERLLDDLERKGARNLDDHELDEFIGLYRITCSDLVRVRSETLGDDVEDYLNLICTRGHKQLHPPAPPNPRGLLRFFSHEFPSTIRAKRGFVLAATLLFVVPIFLSVWAVVNQPSLAYLLSPPAQLEALTDAYSEGHTGGRSEGDDSLMTGYYIRNNIGVAFRCFATGVFFGLGSIFFLVVNGILGGVVGAHICIAGHAENFLSFVIGHGAFELTAIVLSGATGLELGSLLVNPGRYTRLDALKLHGPSMITVILGCAAMLLIAALVEGFWSPSGVPATIKFIVGGVLWFLVILYFVLAGRRRAEAQQ